MKNVYRIAKAWAVVGSVVCTGIGTVSTSHATTVSLSYLEGQQPAAPDAITAWGPQLFGDKVNLFNGALEFEQTDTSLPGNSTLAVAVTRRYVPGRPDVVRGQFGDWDMETPRIGGSFSSLKGWVTSSGGTNRCTGFSLPPVVSSGTGGGGGGGFQSIGPSHTTQSLSSPTTQKDPTGTEATSIIGFIASDYWQGTNLSIPGQGSQELLQRIPGTRMPADGRVYPLVTRGYWQVDCLPAIQNGTGEGFIAVTPDGVRYRFDWMALRWNASVKKSGAEIGRMDHFLMATEVTDRFGNWVRYSYEPANPMLLRQIESSDGRRITVTNAGGRATAVSDGTRTFAYRYDAVGNLINVVQPDGSRWTFNLAGMTAAYLGDMGEGANCDRPGTLPSDDLDGTITHPSGAIGTFKTRFIYLGRTFVDRYCRFAPSSNTYTTGSVYPQLFGSQALLAKSIVGPGMADMNWTYSYSANYGWNPCTGCTDRRVVTVTDPGGAITAHQFGTRWRVNEGQLLRVDEGWTGANWLKTTTYRYRTAADQRFPDQFGASLLRNSDYLASRNRPQDQRVITQQGTTFTWQVDLPAAGFDEFARPVGVHFFSSQNTVRTEVTTYHDNLALWVLGQKARVVELQSNKEVERHSYYDATALKSHSYFFGLLANRFAYRTDGTLETLYDEANRPIAFQDFVRGKPQRAVFADGTVASRVVNNLGNVGSHTNEAGTTTRHDFDAMGRVAAIFYPSGDPVAYAPTAQSFTQVWADEYGLAPGHWRQTVNTGNGYRHRYFDALWRVRLEHRFDAANPGETQSFVETRYDADNRKSFESYPTRTFGRVNLALAGKTTLYDGLDRVIQQRADSELGLLTTTTEYLNGFQRRVTNPRGFATTQHFQVFDTPSEDHLSQIDLADGSWMKIARDVFSKPNSITRGGTYAGTTQQLTRSYRYDPHERLCKTVEPETGATVQGYDAGGNLAWRASGQALTVGTACEDSSIAESVRIRFGYDPRNRLTHTVHGDGSSVITRSYTADGLLKSTVAARYGVNTIGWIYEYNNRRLLKSEDYTWGDPNNSWIFRYDYNALGHVSALRDPWGPMPYEPNALGQPTAVGGYAGAVRYHPNGAVASYTLGNGLTHSVKLNTRGLPEVWTDPGIVSDVYAYDPNGNVTGIRDDLNGFHRSMPWYDELDRLRQAHGPWGAGSFSYDALDNLVGSTVGARSLQHRIDPSTNRLTALTGSQSMDMGYDANGNVVNRNGQAFGFDLGNRLITVPGKAGYAYDGHGRRNLNYYADGTYRHDAYTQDGKLRLSWKLGQGGKRLVYLGDKLIAEVTASGVTTYSHTDALGSPVARTDQAGALIERTRYEPYGATVAMPGSTNPAFIGFTGHVNDGDTGLVYMQQRYYDAVAGRFLSVDPVTTDANAGGHFNRYNYANNNPFGFVDPDGREPCSRGYFSCSTVTYGEVVRAFSETVDKTITGGEGLKFSSALAAGDIPSAGLHLAAGVGYGLAAFAPVGRLGTLAVKGVAAETSVLQKALSQAKPTGGHPQQLMTTLEDGSRVLFRKDFGNKAHSVGGPFQGAGKIDHYNVELQSASGKTLQNLHIVPDGKGGFVWWGKDGMIKP